MSLPVRILTGLLTAALFVGVPLYYQFYQSYDPGTMILSFTLSFLMGSVLFVLLFMRERDASGRSRFLLMDKGFHSWQNLPLDSEEIGIIEVKDPASLFKGPGVGDVAKWVLPLYLLLLIPAIYLFHSVFHHQILYQQSERGTVMSAAYDVAAALVEARMKKFIPQDWETLRKTEKKQLLVVRGAYDRVESIITRSKIEHIEVNPWEIPSDLSETQVILVNCPGAISENSFQVIKDFVNSGGTLITTDWALDNFVSKAFPGMIAPNGQVTGNECVDIEKTGPRCSVTDFMMPEGSHPHWWLFSSFPVAVADAEKVNVFIGSEEMKERYQASPVSAAFRWGQGVVVHIATHFFQHRSEYRTERHSQPSIEYVKECLKLENSDLTSELQDNLEKLKTSPVENAYSTHQFIIGLITEARKNNLGKILFP